MPHSYTRKVPICTHTYNHLLASSVRALLSELLLVGLCFDSLLRVQQSLLPSDFVLLFKIKRHKNKPSRKSQPFESMVPDYPLKCSFQGNHNWYPDFRFASYIYQGRHKLSYKICPQAKHESQKVYELQIHAFYINTYAWKDDLLLLCEGRWFHKVNR